MNEYCFPAFHVATRRVASGQMHPLLRARTAKNPRGDRNTMETDLGSGRVSRSIDSWQAAFLQTLQNRRRT